MSKSYTVPMSEEKKAQIAAEKARAEAVQAMSIPEVKASGKWNGKCYERNSVIYVGGVKRNITPEQYAELMGNDPKPVIPPTPQEKNDWFMKEYGEGIES